MKLFEVYEDMVFTEAWSKLEEVLQSSLFQEEGDSKLNELLNLSNLFIFKAFGIEPKQKGKYFISGSARLFKHPRLLNVLHEYDTTFELTIGDLDVIVPGEKEWNNLKQNYTNTDSDFIKELSEKIGKSPDEIKNKFLKQNSNWEKGIYRPGNGEGGMNLVNADIEAFTIWDPSKAKGAVDVSVRGPSEILKDSVNIGGHYFMNIYDVFDYKSKLNRKKEKQIVKFLQQYLSGEETPQRAEELFKQIGKIVGEDK